MSKKMFSGLYRKEVLKKVFSSSKEGSEFFKVDHSTYYRTVSKQTVEPTFLKKDEYVKFIHPNTYYKFIEDKFLIFLKGKDFKFGCNRCLIKQGKCISDSSKLQNYGTCQFCDNETMVSVPNINNWIKKRNINLNSNGFRILVDHFPKPLLKVNKSKITNLNESDITVSKSEINEIEEKVIHPISHFNDNSNVEEIKDEFKSNITIEKNIYLNVKQRNNYIRSFYDTNKETILVIMVIIICIVLFYTIFSYTQHL